MRKLAWFLAILLAVPLGAQRRTVIAPTGMTGIQSNILPISDKGYDLGSAALRWRNLYVANLAAIGGTGATGSLLSVAEAGAKTAADYAVYVSNTATSSTASINKYGVYITSTGTWNGASANNYGLYVDTPTGGTNNYAAVFAGGNVGMGTTGPSTPLQIQSDAIAASTKLSTTAGYAGLSLKNQADVEQGFLYYFGTTFGTASRQNAVELGTITAIPLKFLTNNAERVRIDIDGNVGIGTTGPTSLLALGGNAARTFQMERHTVADTAGNSLTVLAGGATTGATNKNGGNLVLSGATATGTGSSKISFQTATAGVAGTADRAPTEKATLDGAGTFQSTLYGTVTNCADGTASPADCTAAPAGAVIISAAATAVVVNTTAVTANSNIFVMEDSSLGTRLSVTCNTTIARNYAVTARTAATSFTITTDVAPVTNPACLNYFIVN